MQRVAKWIASLALTGAWAGGVYFAVKGGFDPGYVFGGAPAHSPYPLGEVIVAIVVISAETLLFAAILRPWGEMSWYRFRTFGLAVLGLSVMELVRGSIWSGLPGYRYANTGFLELLLIAIVLSLPIMGIVRAMVRADRYLTARRGAGPDARTEDTGATDA